MDAAALKSLLWLLVWRVLFFVTMRYGCGAHIGGHRHGAHRRPEGPGEGGVAKDPVCGMSMDLRQTKAASVHAGNTYYFCSPSCRDKFEQDPGTCVSGGIQPSAPQGGRHG